MSTITLHFDRLSNAKKRYIVSQKKKYIKKMNSYFVFYHVLRYYGVHKKALYVGYIGSRAENKAKKDVPKKRP